MRAAYAGAKNMLTDFFINIVNLVYKLLLHPYFNTFGHNIANIQNVFLNINIVPEQTLVQILNKK